MSRPAKPWARVHLARGRSSGDLWEVDRSTSGARIDVGASPSCVWQVNAPGVRPFHLEMYWDGEVLWVADLEGAPVRIDGQVVDDWYATAHGTRIELGEAALRVETSQQEFDDPHVADAPSDERTAIERSRSFGDTATDVTPGERSELHDAPTRVAGAGALDELGRAARGELSGAPTRAAGPAAGASPVFGGAAAAADPNATRLVQTPESRLEGAPGVSIHRRPPPPRIGAGARNVRRAPPRPAPAPPTPAPPAQRPKSAPPPPPPRSAPPPPPPVQPSEPAAAAPEPPSEPPPSTPPGPDKPRFAAPPPLDDGTAGSGRRAGKAPSGPKKPRIGGKEMSLPPRTWALLGATVLALAYVILMDDGPVEEPPPAPAATEAEPEEPTGEEGSSEEESEGGDDGTTALGARPTDTTGPPPETDRSPEESADEEEAEVDRTLVRRAVDALMAGRRQEALDLYRRLAEADPDEPAYGAIVGILEDRIGDCEVEPCE